MHVKISERENGRKRVQIFLDPESKTEQSHKKRCDINTIMAKARKTGQMPIKSGAFYGDFTTGVEYQDYQNKILEANEAFMNLPSDVRKKFNNNPSELIDFVNDPENEKEAADLGLFENIEDPVSGQAVREPAATPADVAAPAVEKGQDDTSK